MASAPAKRIQAGSFYTMPEDVAAAGALDRLVHAE
jgi:hypothetical protein